jgi:hypothetical protein
MPWRIAQAVNHAGWRTLPSHGHARLALFTPNRIRCILGNPRYAGLARYRGEIVAVAQWPGYITREQHERLVARRRRRRSRGPTVNPRQPFLLARLAVCGLCCARMITVAGHNRMDGLPTYRYVCRAHHERQCSAPRINARFVDTLFVENLEDFLLVAPDTFMHRLQRTLVSRWV